MYAAGLALAWSAVPVAYAEGLNLHFWSTSLFDSLDESAARLWGLEDQKSYRQQSDCTCTPNCGNIIGNGTHEEWLAAIADVDLSTLVGAPAYQTLRDSASVVKMASDLCVHDGFSADLQETWPKTPIWIDISYPPQHLADHAIGPVEGRGEICHIEVRDGNHRAVALEMSTVFQKVRDLAREDIDLIKISVNGRWPSDRQERYNIAEEAWPRFVPYKVGQEVQERCGMDFRKYINSRGELDAILPEDFTSNSICLQDNRGASLAAVAKNTAIIDEQTAPKECSVESFKALESQCSSGETCSKCSWLEACSAALQKQPKKETWETFKYVVIVALVACCCAWPHIFAKRHGSDSEDRPTVAPTAASQREGDLEMTAAVEGVA
eukprot:TRINITY_DN37976_c0_g1_i1.p1 TRINITY_DN37976_c0_g1~~TRINITY_DN37976_c0_g1_i1.p1  ORF type:complete len:381 (-),score=71.59 TRINITY_DN37976_c0_g1_i1:105-1247(-)